MENNNIIPIKLARELGFSIIDSNEYINLKKLEEEIISQNLLENVEVVQGSHDNTTNIENMVLNTSSNEQIQRSYNDSNIIQQYLEAKKNYDKLLKNIYNIIEYITGDLKKSSSVTGCCGKCNAGCNGCENRLNQ
ncbi:MAG: YlbF family regulator [Tissierellales bacterium]